MATVSRDFCFGRIADHTKSDERFMSPIPTGAAADSTLESTAPKTRAGWQHVIDDVLIEWGRDLGELEDDGLIPPTHASLSKAIECAAVFRDKGAFPPLRTVPTGDGGIQFERRLKVEGRSIFELIEIENDGKVRLEIYLNYVRVASGELDI